MKKIGLFAVVIGMAIAFAIPALAFTIDGAKGERLYIGGLLMTDFGVRNTNKDFNALSDRTEFFMAVPNNSQFRALFEAGPAGGYVEFGIGGMTDSGQIADTRYVETRKAYGFYKFGNCQFLAGKNDGYLTSGIIPYTYLGYNLTKYTSQQATSHTVGYGFGGLNDPRYPLVRFSQQINKQFGYAINLVDPAEFIETNGGGVGVSRTSYSTIPALSAKVSMDFGVIALYPAAIWLQSKWDKLASGWDDSMTAYLAILPVKVTVGPFTAQGQFGYGQNIGQNSTTGAGLIGGESLFQSYQRTAAGQIKNTTATLGFIDLSYTVGPITPHIYFGYNNAKNSDFWVKGDDNTTRLMYGISANCKVNDNFTLVPELTVYDYGTKPGDAAKTSLGKEVIGGVQFRFLF